MKIQVCSLAIALAIAVPIVVAATVESSAAPLNGASIKARVPAVTTECLIGRGKFIHLRFVPGHPSYDYSCPGYACDGW